MRCWSCGANIPGGSRHVITCPICSTLEEIKEIRERLESSGATSLSVAINVIGPDLSELIGILEAGFEGLSGQLADIASILEWGFEEIDWRLGQIRETLKSIDKTLKTPGATQANEWRQIAEELRERGVLDESEKFFLRGLETNPLDYRTYIGLGKTYLQMGKIEKARTLWEKSLPHAPKREIDYKSYSCRLIGRTYFCEEDYRQAASTLRTAIELSPNYYLGHYDYAQYCALIGDKKDCLSSLQIAVVKEPIPVELVRREANFKSFRKGIEILLKQIDPDEIKFRSALKELGGPTVSTFDAAEIFVKKLETKVAKLKVVSEKRCLSDDLEAFFRARDYLEIAQDWLKSARHKINDWRFSTWRDKLNKKSERVDEVIFFSIKAIESVQIVFGEKTIRDELLEKRYLGNRSKG